MSAFTEKLRAYGADTDGALERFVGDETFYEDCFRMFLKDPGFAELEKAMAVGDISAAFKAAHTLKGVSGNLGLTPLYRAVCALVEPLRRGERTGLEPLYQAVREERDAAERLG